MRQRPRHVGDLARDLADLFRHREQELGAKAVGRERDRRFLLGRGGYGLLLTGRIRDHAQRIDHLRALFVVLERLQRTLGFLRRQCGSPVGGRRLGADGGKRRDREEESGEERRGKLVRHENSLEKRMRRRSRDCRRRSTASCRIDAIRPGAVSEVGQRGDILLAFAAMQEREPSAPRGRTSADCDAHNKILPSFRESARNDGEEEEKAGCQSACHGGRITAIRHDRCDAKYSAGKVGALPH
ncbi:hypothetical protein ABIF20_005618 [Bradyrhizobium japonicum]|uniref:hypothetical protein n=1 Tax=Bradyrhizobium japonicum TaxID=375 RepID=UPI00383254DC